MAQNQLQKFTESPYFSPTRKRNVSPYSKRFDCEEAPESTSDELSFEPGPPSIIKDPLFRFHLRTFLRLFHNLWLAKPVLIQESVANINDPWKVLIATTLLNKTCGKLSIPVFHTLTALYPTPSVLANAQVSDIAALIQPLGLNTIRANRMVLLSKKYLADPPIRGCLRESRPPIYITRDKYVDASSQRYPPTPISHLPGTGPYALDSYRVFCGEQDEWKEVVPTDKELVRYLKWKWAFIERKRWFPAVGAQGMVDAEYLDHLTSDLRESAPS